MTFTQIEFLVFLVVVVTLTWGLRRFRPRAAKLFLLIASYYFYAYWDYRFCGLLILSTTIDYIAGKQIAASTNRSAARAWLMLSLGCNLGLLAFFKYAALVIESALNLVVGQSPTVLDEGWWQSIVLPVGISFFTFQTLSYTIDVYRGMPPCRSLARFALYVAFFPQLVAGPIVRASEFLPQLAVAPEWSRGRFHGGLGQLIRGAFKKIILADRLAEMSDVIFAGPDLYSGGTLAIGVLAYTAQIYYDFSGYTDMAIGTAKLLGYRFPVNFRHPYVATNIAEFWHRWHITLSRFLRDYLYIPLGGSRGGRWRTRRNLLLTMALGGLWHGAAWTFLAWGVYHGGLLIVHRWWTGVGRLPRPIAGAITLLAVAAGWVLFRAESFADAGTIYARILTGASGIEWFPPLPLLALAMAMIDHVGYRTRLRRWWRMPAGSWVTPVLVTLALWTLVVCPPRDFRPFVYFQF